jgi:hypothetical protein
MSEGYKNLLFLFAKNDRDDGGGAMLYNGRAYGQWRFAGNVLIHRCKTRGGAERLKLPLHPPLAKCDVTAWHLF